MRKLLAAESTSVAFILMMRNALLDPELKNAVIEQLLDGLRWSDLKREKRFGSLFDSVYTKFDLHRLINIRKCLLLQQGEFHGLLFAAERCEVFLFG
ncbi:hypothetical protein D3C84_758480 [compost metagenome]